MTERRPKKRDRRDFEEWEAEEKSDDSDVERESRQARPEHIPAEVRQLQEDMDRRGRTGLSGYKETIRGLDQRIQIEQQLQDERDDKAHRRQRLRTDEDLLIPEDKVRSAMMNEMSESRLHRGAEDSMSMDGDDMSMGGMSQTNKSRTAMEFTGTGREFSDRAMRMGDDSTHKTLPQPNDPRLWMVKCYKSGFEKEFCANLINKFAHLVNTKGPGYLDEVPIYSVFASDAAKGQIWIEAFREIDVREFIQGMRGLGAWNIHLVPTHEMIGVFNMATYLENEKKDVIKIGTWGRLKRGIFKNDLCIVLKVTDNEIKVKCKPRPAFMGDGDQGKVPRQEFLTLEIARELKLPVINEGFTDCGFKTFEIGGEIFTCDSGHNIKTISKSSIITKVTTSLAEEEAFSNPQCPEAYAMKDKMADEDRRAIYRKPVDAVRGGAKIKTFLINERVRVKSGQLGNLLCRVVELLPQNQVRVEAEFAGEEWKRVHGQGSGKMDLPTDIIEKYFEIGDRIKALDGENKGETGMVVKVEEKEKCCIIVSDTREERGFPVEFSVSIWDMTVSSERKEMETVSYGFKIADLVTGPDKLNGIITALGRSSAKVVTELGQKKDWSFKQMVLKKSYRAPSKKGKGGKLSRDEWVLDARGQKIYVNHLVCVGATQNRRRMVGTVVHIVRQTKSGQERIFVQDNQTLGEEKYVCCLARECESRTPVSQTAAAEAKRKGKGKGKNRMQIMDDGQRMMIEDDGTQRIAEGLEGLHTNLLKKGRRVVILSGAYRTQLAELRDVVDDNFVRVQLLTKPKMMQFHKRSIAFHDLPSNNINAICDLPTQTPSTPIMELDVVEEARALEDTFGTPADGGADPWDNRFKLPAPIRKKHEAAWDPTFRKSKKGQQVWEDPSDRASIAGGEASPASKSSKALPIADDDKLMQVPGTPGSVRSVRSRRTARTLGTQNSAAPPSPAPSHGPQSPRKDDQVEQSVEKSISETLSKNPTSNLPIWCQKGVRVITNDNQEQGYINICLFNNIFVMFDGNRSGKFLPSDVRPIDISVGDQVVILQCKDMNFVNKVGICQGIDTQRRIAQLAFRGFPQGEYSLDEIASYRYKHHVDDDNKSDSQSIRSDSELAGKKSDDLEKAQRNKLQMGEEELGMGRNVAQLESSERKE